MTIELQRALQAKCDADGRLGLLFAQWEYDRRLVGEALNTVGYNFPHYSRHDASHSDNILLQITRVLGPRVGELSATDIWLILEAAYWHDSGMIIDAETAMEWWRNAEFKRHIDGLRESADPMLVNAARIVSEAGLSKGELWPLQVRKAVTLVLADFGRVQHAQRSGQAVLHPMLQGIKSPRALIPQRLFYWLAEITVQHGGSFDEVMQLPYEEAGLGTETCHPRFVAFMLRLGDLLDLDNGRFCDVMTRSIGTLPTSSLDHVGKHASIQHFSVSPEQIAVTAVCSDEKAAFDPYGPYEAVSSWLDWLKQELMHLATQWAHIAPRNFGGAPSLGKIEAVLNGYISLESGRRPKFSFDEPAFLKLVRGKNLYRSRFAWVRELMTNAEDATLIRLHHEAAIPPLKYEDPDPYLAIREQVARFPIQVHLMQEDDSIRVEIHDQGTGISKADLRYMLNIGSSGRNRERRAAIHAMPEHARPTGNFGIGLQSVFMATDELEMFSMHVRSGDRLHIRIRRSSGDGAALDVLNPLPERAGVYIKSLEDGQLPRQPGTIIRFRISARPPQISVEQGADAPQGDSAVSGSSVGTDPDDFKSMQGPRVDFDPIHAEQPGGELERVIAEFGALARTMIATVAVNGVVLERNEQHAKIMVFDPERGLMFKFRGATRQENPVALAYRGAPIAQHALPPIPIVDVEVNAEFGSALDVVAASRETLTPEGEQLLSVRVREGLANVYATYADRLAKERGAAFSDPERQLVSLFGKVYLDERVKVSHDAGLWREVELIKRLLTGPVTMGHVAAQGNMSILESRHSYAPHTPFVRPDGDWHEIADRESRQVARDALLSVFSQVRLVGISSSELRYALSRDGTSPVSADASEVQALVRELSYREPLGRSERVIWPLLDGFEPLKLDTEGAVRFRSSQRLPRWVLKHEWLVRWVMVLPLEFRSESRGTTPKISLRHLESYVLWVREHVEPTNEPKSKRTESILDATQRLATLIYEGISPSFQDFEGKSLSPDQAKQQLEEQCNQLRTRLLSRGDSGPPPT